MRPHEYCDRAFGKCLLPIVLAGLASGVCAQSASKQYHVPWLGPGGAVPEAERKWGDFPQALRDLGYVEDRNVVIDYRFAAGNADKLPELAAELVRLKVDVIVASGEPATLAAALMQSSEQHGGSVVIRPANCQVWFKLGDAYFVSDSDSDRHAKVLKRTVQP